MASAPAIPSATDDSAFSALVGSPDAGADLPASASSTGPSASREVKRPSASMLRLERAFAGTVVVLPFLGVLAALVYRVMTWTDLALLVAFYTLTGFGITVGYHRLFTHGAFACRPWLRATFAILGSMALQGPVIRWVADHRRHHAHSDRPGDPHSPHVEGGTGMGGAIGSLWHAHVGWLFDAEKTRLRRFAPDLLEDRGIAAIDRHYLLWVVLSLGLPAALGGALTASWQGALSGLLYGGLVRAFLIHHVTWSINSFCHYFGTQPYVTSDHSTNNRWLAIPSLGESWHNNHHAFPTAAVHGVDGFQPDLSGVLIRTLAALGQASDLKQPTPEFRARRLRA